MVLTITLNTSIDKAYCLTEPIADGTVMRVKECINVAGGKGLNASRAISTCGEDVIATGFCGGNNGRLLCELLAQDGISESFVHVKNETRCCVNVLDPDGRSTEFLEPGREVTPDEVGAFLRRIDELLKDADVVTINGSVPKGLPTDTYATLVERIKQTSVPVILDTSGELLREGIRACPTMVKPNTDEIGQLLGRCVSSLDEVARAASDLHEQGIQKVVVSLGGDGALMACDEGVFRGIAPAIEVVNPVGAGDTMVGAFAVGIARGMAPDAQLAYAMSCASANCLSPSTGHFDMGVARDLLSRTTVEKIA
ncbi:MULTISPECIES: 1-phosphofructokinase family hexose kinase [Atopobiaceae]|uniref:Tagatose 6-phosphate kinase n=1 Tax=Parafannyhessea umbonata TaxID=604330 RepID=A0A1H6IEE3_9ACTN|nr:MULTISPECIES: 1-phosphofructokinase family hexose kinase [Atopobiaceae]SEH44664.1 tagatose 6-phosphate kinase [Parafannyhessea umbonata]SJZ60685.1 tagatose 6-phosphate kinase [Olsenella sp. KH1P3]